MSNKTEMKHIDRMASECLGFSLRKLNRVISGFYDTALLPYGIKISQMNLLIVIYKMERAKPADICAYVQMDVSTLSRNTERMQSKGWLRFLPGEDGRTHFLALTIKGKKLLINAYPAWAKAQRRAIALLGDGLSKQLLQVSDTLLGTA